MGTIRTAMLCMGYMSVTDAPICINRAHQQADFSSGRRSFVCARGGFFVNSTGTCNEHEPRKPQIAAATEGAKA